jgi:hypothetical protein
MATKHRVFSTNNIINYDDYLKMKQGTECLKTIISDNQSKPITLNQFVNYEQFIYLSKSFYKQLHTSNCKSEYVTNLYNANDSSYIQHNQKGLIPQVDLCNSQVLYPYGQYTRRQSENLYFPYNLDMNRLCRENKTCNEASHINTTDNNILPTSNCGNSKTINSKKCKTGLCKNAKQLFI